MTGVGTGKRHADTCACISISVSLPLCELADTRWGFGAALCFDEGSGCCVSLISFLIIFDWILKWESLGNRWDPKFSEP